MKKSAFSLILVALSTTIAFGTWALIPLEKAVSESDIIVVGTLHSASEDSGGSGQGYILIDQLITRGSVGKHPTTSGHQLKSGDNLKIKWLDDWACARGMHMRWQAKKGLWLLAVEPDGTVRANNPSLFRSMEDVQRVKELLEANANDELFEHAVDITPFDDLGPTRAAIAMVLSFGLYLVLYRSRFRIR